MMKRHCGCKNGWMMRSLIFVRENLDITGITIRETGESGNGARFEMTVPKGAYRCSENQIKTKNAGSSGADH